MKHYKLVGHDVVPCSAEECWNNIDETRRIARDVLPNGVEVSTVFLGLDHNFSDAGPAIVFETMVFGGENDQAQVRYSTWEQAVAGHAQMLKVEKGE